MPSTYKRSSSPSFKTFHQIITSKLTSENSMWVLPQQKAHQALRHAGYARCTSAELWGNLRSSWKLFRDRSMPNPSQPLHCSSSWITSGWHCVLVVYRWRIHRPMVHHAACTLITKSFAVPISPHSSSNTVRSGAAIPISSTLEIYWKERARELQYRRCQERSSQTDLVTTSSSIGEKDCNGFYRL